MSTYYIARDGNDVTGSGTITAPWFSPLKALNYLKAGDTLYCRDGSYPFKVQQYLGGKSGVSGNPIQILAYQNEKPVFTKGPGYTNNYHRGGCYFSGDYVHFKGLEIKGFTQPVGDPALWNGLLIMNSNNNVFELINHHDNGSALYQEGNCTGNLFLNCDSWNNYDDFENGGNADGFSAAYNTNTSSVTTYKGCRTWNNSDDGFDTWDNQGMVVFEDCWSWKNGWKPGTTIVAGNGMGFKLAGGFSSSVTKRKVTNCLSFSNLNHGFSQENEGIKSEFYNCTTHKNNGGWWFNGGAGSIFNKCIAFNNTNNQVMLGSVTSTNCSASGNGDKSNWENNVNDADFVSVSSVGMDGPRQADGSLPSLNFLRLNNSDPMIAGRGYTYGGTVTPPTTQPTVNAGQDATVPLANAGNVGLSASGTPGSGATISSWFWAKLSGPACAISSPTTATTRVNGMVTVGDYVFEVTLTDSKNQIVKDQVTVKVIANPPADTKIYCSVILHGMDLKRREVAWFEKKSDGFYYDSNGIKRDVFLYKGTDGKWYYKSGTTWVILF